MFNKGYLYLHFVAHEISELKSSYHVNLEFCVLMCLMQHSDEKMQMENRLALLENTLEKQYFIY